ncbi:MAG TPA: FAD:protein FMN transferase [Solirubrobacteraceae bacterium]|jgi:thiamine biosynthesis lipoprotein|nr:FAD:protein FMN transferase [Solirubrobacteraceae bacterium]
MTSSERTAIWQALGTTAVLRLAQAGAAGSLNDAKVAVASELDAIDRACSRFRPDSDLSRCNAAAGQAVPVKRLLIDALEVAIGAAEATEGLVDPSVGTALELAGYACDWSLLQQRSSVPAAPAAPVVIAARRAAGWRGVQIDRARSTVRVPAGVKLDLGATAKAWAADRAAATAFRRTGIGALVALGGDIATAGAAPSGGWRIRVTDDHRASLSAPGQTVSIHDGGLATSSVTVRRWSKGDTEMHHIIDPATGEPARGAWRTASVAAASCTDANIASTAAILLSEQAIDWLAQRGLPARLVSHDGGVLHLAGWPAQPVQVAA